MDKLKARAAAPCLLPRRARESSKHDYGRLLIVGGSVGYSGAPTLASRAAVRGGAGLVHLAVPRDIYTIAAVKNDEAALRNRAEALIYQAERAQKKLQSEDQKRLKEPIQRVQKALAGQDTAGLKAACDDLEQLLESIGYHSGDSSDGSYDADYTEN